MFGASFSYDAAPTDVYTLSLHDALPISPSPRVPPVQVKPLTVSAPVPPKLPPPRDRNSTRLNSWHVGISSAASSSDDHKPLNMVTLAPLTSRTPFVPPPAVAVNLPPANS